MTPLRRSAALLGIAAAFAWPAGALAQGSAGDNQYQDPFGGGQGAKKKPATPKAKPMPQLAAPPPGTPSAGGTSQSPTPGPTAAAAVPQTATPTAAAPTASSAELPRTGADPLLEALAGAGLLLAGLGVRLRTRGA